MNPFVVVVDRRRSSFLSIVDRSKSESSCDVVEKKIYKISIDAKKKHQKSQKNGKKREKNTKKREKNTKMRNPFCLSIFSIFF